MKSRLAAILLLCWPAAAQEQPAQTGKGVIEGVVLNEVTRDPVRKAVVTLGGPTQPVIATADQSGRFVFRGLPPGQFWIMAQRTGFGAAPMSESGRQVTLAANEEKTGIEITMMPLGSISGRIFDQFNAPIAFCNVNAMKPGHGFPGRHPGFAGTGAAQPTNDKGEYRIQDLAPGRYYVFARCSREMVAPHPLMAADDPRMPHQVYRAQFYPGSADQSGATRISVAPGAEVRGIDLQMRRADAFTVRGRVGTAEGNAIAGPVQINLSEDAPALAGWTSFGGATDQQKGTFEIRSVPAGSYVLAASTVGEGPRYQARMRVEIGDTPPDPVEVVLAPGADVSGTVEMESRNPGVAPQITISSTDPGGMGSFAQSEVDKDGAFVLHGVFSGHLNLAVMNVPGYIKEFQIGDRQVNPHGFDLAAGPWRVVIGTKTGKLSGTVAGTMPENGTVWAMLVPAVADIFAMGAQAAPVSREGRFELSSVQPGRYRVFALETPNPSAIAADPELVKLIENRGQAVDVAEGETAQAATDIIHADELKRLLQEVE